ncbi:hypothetical protein [Mesorhizobium sp. M4B.F.Ca.ET.049.02.1.2]|uniref:hypothetical protein n=1 Tax=Mesorhizobium sp. M4B.F.Ca.ET.049.02.1.2 TaxID=2496752 RepID=UPI000FCA45C5|nr:hypothetical protein [Mesorhizobium sp. M4B.F.Ca.ET.049.02.1.2]RUW72120.1 hypothetical protein EOA31_16320 [Mesorhizobium sp. M4B.F.Ca.ET.049.02.1.2]
MKKDELVGLKAVRSRLSRLPEHLPKRGGTRWLAVLLGVLVAVSTILYGGHSDAAMPGNTHSMIKHELAFTAAHQHHRAPCDQPSQAGHHGDSCVSASSCSFCVPVEGQVFMSVSGSEPAATAPAFISSPSDVPIRLRPPKLVVTA